MKRDPVGMLLSRFGCTTVGVPPLGGGVAWGFRLKPVHQQRQSRHCREIRHCRSWY